ncbi:alpha/beta fold hydrolase [Streptomyces sp. NPDC006482]|uniref:thioesterase domain-containing protein n=1 Tax=Streptomyces sp. NPDC006482 TaxID=3154306 RepID=UPI0033BD5489
MSDHGTLVPLRTDGSLTPLYCVHPVSGSGYVYAGLAEHLDPEQPLYGFEAPGFDDGDLPLTSIEALAERHLESLRSARPQGPYLLLGWSLGGVVAYHMAQLLAEAGEEVPLLIVVDATVPERFPMPSEKTFLHGFLRDLVMATGEPLDAVDALVLPHPEDVTAEAVWAAVTASEVLPEEFDEEFLQERYDVFRAHAQALFVYDHRGAYAGPMLLLQAADSPDERMRWETLADRLEKRKVAGNHNSIWTGEALGTLAGLIGQGLERARSAPASVEG